MIETDYTSMPPRSMKSEEFLFSSWISSASSGTYLPVITCQGEYEHMRTFDKMNTTVGLKVQKPA